MRRENPRKNLLVGRAEIEPMVAAATVIADCRRELAARDRDIALLDKLGMRPAE